MSKLSRRTWLILAGFLVALLCLVGTIVFHKAAPVQDVKLAQNFELIPCYYPNGEKPQMVFDNAKVTPTLFIQNKAKDIDFAKQMFTEAAKLGPSHRPIVVMDTLLHTSDPTQAIQEIKLMKLNTTTMVLAGDPYLYPTQTPALVYWDQASDSFKTVTDQVQILKLVPTILNLDNKEGAKKP